MDNGKQSDVLVIDFSKAFDKVSHLLLVHKLKHYGIIGNINTWIKKGSVLGSSLFLYYIIDMPI